jgi:hypothetical protein
MQTLAHMSGLFTHLGGVADEHAVLLAMSVIMFG